jgi:hypothetical protein
VKLGAIPNHSHGGPTGNTIGAVSGIDPSESPKVLALPTTPVHSAAESLEHDHRGIDRGPYR